MNDATQIARQLIDSVTPACEWGPRSSCRNDATWALTSRCCRRHQGIYLICGQHWARLITLLRQAQTVVVECAVCGHHCRQGRHTIQPINQPP